MARKKNHEDPAPEMINGNIALPEELQEIKKPFEIREASIKDDFCNYSYEITDGVGLGDTHVVKGSAIVDDDLKTAFSIFNVHLACIDDIFKHAEIKYDYINALHGDPHTGLYHVTGFKIKGVEENMGIVLIGNKYVTAGGRINLESPKIMLDNSSSYKWFAELKTAAEEAIREVELYKGGKCTPVEVEEEKTKLKQTKIKFEQPAGVEMESLPGVSGIELDEDFDNAEV